MDRALALKQRHVARHGESPAPGKTFIVWLFGLKMTLAYGDGVLPGIGIDAAVAWLRLHFEAAFADPDVANLLPPILRALNGAEEMLRAGDDMLAVIAAEGALGSS